MILIVNCIVILIFSIVGFFALLHFYNGPNKVKKKTTEKEKWINEKWINENKQRMKELNGLEFKKVLKEFL